MKLELQARGWLSMVLGCAALAGAIGCRGTPTPVALAMGEEEASVIAVSGANLYWLQGALGVEPGALRTIPTAGGTAATVVAMPTPRAMVIADGSAIIGSSNGNVYQVALASGTSTVLIPKSITSPVLAVAASSGFAYVALGTGAIERASLTPPANVQLIQDTTGSITFLSADATYVYWGTGSGDISRQPVDGSGSTELLGNIDNTSPTTPVFLGNSIYFFGPTYVSALNTSTGMVSTVLENISTGRTAINAWGLAGNGSSLLIGLQYGIATVDPSNGSAAIFLPEGVPGTSLAADGENVYWISGAVDLYGNPADGNTIYKGRL